MERWKENFVDDDEEEEDRRKNGKEIALMENAWAKNPSYSRSFVIFVTCF